MVTELDGQIDTSRIHFVGALPYQQYLTVFQVSAAHVYLTYPFVLSWSLIEALAAGCVVIGSRTPPVEEVIDDGHSGQLVDFFDTAELADAIVTALRRRRDHRRMREAARDLVLRRYDLERICLPGHIALLHALMDGIAPGDAPQFRHMADVPKFV
jgi:glycosyltransferase involved in cell wall biosynthesis